ncbi:hypothetical protein AbraIFM66950_002029, partial [Aspergillus brasiliensis]
PMLSVNTGSISSTRPLLLTALRDKCFWSMANSQAPQLRPTGVIPLKYMLRIAWKIMARPSIFTEFDSCTTTKWMA